MTWPAADYQTPDRMAAKLRAIPLPDLAGKRVIDVGCDFGFWSRLACERGAGSVLGLDRNRMVRGHGMTDLVAMNRSRATGAVSRFERLDLGRQWHSFEPADVVFLFSLYHHVFESAGGDHRPVWYWLWRHVAPGGVLLWENPLDCGDPVVRANVSAANQRAYTREQILAAASRWFDAERIGPALHEPTREVWRFTPKPGRAKAAGATMVDGSGGATKAFLHADGRRQGELLHVLGFRPAPGSLNLRCAEPFDWEVGYYRAEVLDVADRQQGFGGRWEPRWCRFYPVTIGEESAMAMRFEGDRYPAGFVEIVAGRRLRDLIPGPETVLARTL